MTRSCPTRTGRALPALAIVTLCSAPGAAHHTVNVPIRWCAIEGSPAAVAPDCVCETNTRDVLSRRHRRTANEIWTFDCAIWFRSAASSAQSTFPIIADPCPPPGCEGGLGDVVATEADGSGDVLDEFEEAIHACAVAWNQPWMPALGVIGINARHFVTETGTISGKAGHGVAVGFFEDDGPAAFIVKDNDFALAGGMELETTATGEDCTIPSGFVGECSAFFYDDPTDRVLGHEIGHTLSLGHGSGHLMTTSDLLGDEGHDLTTGGPGSSATSCPPGPLPQATSQCGQARLYALCNLQLDDPGPSLTTIIDEEPLPADRSLTAAADLRFVGIADRRALDRASFYWQGRGPFQVNETISYAFALDLDGDPDTGADPGRVGVEIPLAGADLVGTMRVRTYLEPATLEKRFDTDASLWKLRCDSCPPEPQPPLDVTAGDRLMWIDDVKDARESRPVPFASRGVLSFDRSLLMVGSPPAVPERVRFQALSRKAAGDERDLPSARYLYLVEGALPRCEATPASVFAGDVVTVTATGLSAYQDTRVLLGDRRVAAGQTDATGSTRSTFTVPLDLVAGERAVTIGVSDPSNAVTADCALEVSCREPPPNPRAPCSAAGYTGSEAGNSSR